MWLFKKKKQLSPSIQKFINLLDAHDLEESKKPYGERDICPIAIEPQLVVDCLCNLFLGEDWYVALPISTKQVNTVILDNILYEHCPEYRKEVKKMRKERDSNEISAYIQSLNISIDNNNESNPH